MGTRKNMNIIKIDESIQFSNCNKNNILLIINSNIETLIINGSNNIIIIEGGVITMIIKGNDNKILTGKDSFGIQNTIFQGNDNRIIIKNPSANINIIDNGYYNSVFRKKKINKEIKVHLNIKIEKLLTKKRNLNLELKLEQC